MQKIIVILIILIISGCGAVSSNKRVTPPKSYPDYKTQTQENEVEEINPDCSLIFLSAC